jgi:hypothetical protein
MPWITNLKSIQSSFDTLKEKSRANQRITVRETFLDREMPYLLTA